MGAPKRTADVVVVGGGCTGSSIAWHLARAGADVVLVERNHIGSGATGHSGALIRRHYEHSIGIALAHESLQFFESFKARTGWSAGFVRTGFTAGARAPDESALKRLVALQRAHGVSVQLTTPDELTDLEPGMRVDDLALGVFDPRGGYADPVATAFGFARASGERGGEVYEGTVINRVLVQKDRVVGVRGKGIEFRAVKVVLAAGNWTPELAVTAGVRLPIRFVRGEVVLVRRPPDFGPPPRLHFDHYNDTYSRPDGAQDTLIGFMRTDLRRARTKPPSDGSVPADTARDLQLRLAARFPGIGRAQPRGGWTGSYDVTPDRYPILGPCGPTGLFVAAGFSGHGFKLCPSVGRLITKAVLGDGPDPILEALNRSRFARGRRIRPEAPFPDRSDRLP